MKEISTQECVAVAGGASDSARDARDPDCTGICKTVDEIIRADWEGAYDRAVSLMEYIMERVSPLPNVN